MRDVLFRGRIVSNYTDMDGKLIFGHLVVRPVDEDEPPKYFICQDGYNFIRCLNKMPRTFEVDPDTIGEYVGIKDKHGVMIFEGDIVRARIEDKKSPYDTYAWPDMRVVFENGAFCLIDNIGRIFAALGAFASRVTFEVVGNIYGDDVDE